LELTTLVVIGTDCIGSYKSNYHTITDDRVSPNVQVHVKHGGKKLIKVKSDLTLSTTITKDVV